MLSGLFKPGWQSGSVEKRLEALEKMDALDAANQSVFTELAKKDTESRVRIAAITKLTAPDLLFDISQTDLDADAREKATSAFSVLIGAKSRLSEEQFRALIASNPSTSLSVAKHCPHADLRSELILARSETEQADLIAEVEYTETRQLIAQQLTSIEPLEIARKTLKGKDKNAEKIIKSKLDTLHAQVRQQQQDIDTAESLCEKMDYLASHVSDDWQADFRARYQVCSSQWQALNFAADTELLKRYMTAFDIVRAEIERQDSMEATRNQQEQLAQSLEDYCSRIAGFSEQQISAIQTEIKDSLGSAADDWLGLSESIRPHLNTADQYLLAQKSLSSLLAYARILTASDDSSLNENSRLSEKNAASADSESDVEIADSESNANNESNATANKTSEAAEQKTKMQDQPQADVKNDENSDVKPHKKNERKNEADLLKQKIRNLEKSLSVLNWPNSYPSLELKVSVTSELANLKDQNKAAQQQASEKLDKLHKKINGILGATRRGDVGRAKRDLAAATKAAEHYSGKDRIALDERLEKTAEAVGKMGDWKDFATEPKYIELCGAMEALVKSKSNPDQLAEEIAELQKRWKALGHSDSSDQHWERFKTAGDKAYEPCSLFFKERRETRQKNLKDREPLITQMRDILENTEWDGSPDYKQVESELRRITNEWQKIKNVEQGAGQKQWNRLSKLKSSIYEKLDLVYDANIALKNQLIEQATSLLELDAKEESINTLQQLQMRWKQVGVTRRKQDQAAWTNFKAATDNVYEKIQGVRQEKRAEENAQLEGYRSLSRQIQNLSKTAKDLAESDSNFDRLQTEYQALPELPKGLPEKLIEGLATDFRKACESYGNARDKIKQAGRHKELDMLAEKAAVCAQLEQLGADAPAEKIEQLRVELADIPLTNKELLRRLEPRLTSALDSSRSDADRDQANQTRRMLCIDLEILLGEDSPAEDKQLRMKVQFDRMKKDGIGRGQVKKETMLSDLKLDWLCLPGADPAIQISLDKRFESLIKKA